MKTNLLHLVLLPALFLCGLNKPVSALSFSSRIDSIQLIIDPQQLTLPGETFQIGIISYQRNGKIKKTIGLSGGSVWWWRYKVEVTGGTDFSGRITVNDRLVPSKGKYISVKAFPRKQPELQKEILIPLNYETKISFQPDNTFDKAPGSHIEGKLISVFDNGITRVYDNLKRNKDAENFIFYGTGGYWNRGEFTIDPDFTKIEKHQAALIVNSVRNRAVADTFSVLLDYKHKYKLSIRGNSGMPGFSGTNGSSGSSGSHGGDGQPGQHGEFGQHAPDIGVWVDMYRDSILNMDLLYVYAQDLWEGEEYRYLINPNGGSLIINSIGGSGGNGGNGGRGGDGGKGDDGQVWIERKTERRIVKKPFKEKVIRKEKKTVIDSDGKPKEIEVDVEVEVEVMKDVEEDVVVEIRHQGPGDDGGDGGWGGPGGLGGIGGNGGNIYLYFTDDAWGYQHLFIANSQGGTGGSNGSGGSGGTGGPGGKGNPSGSDGHNGQNGASAIGWAPDGYSGDIIIQPTEEFFEYVPEEK